MRLTEQEARVLHAFRTGKFEHTTTVTDSEWLVAHIKLHFDTLLVLCSCSGNLGDISLEVTSSRAIDALNLHGVVGSLFQEVEELEGLHLVLAERALEG